MKYPEIHTLFKKPGGFTIVELLIVVVIIGILAAITIVVFSGIQTRAANTSRISTAKQAAKLIQGYMGAYSDYPWKTSASMCIGKNFPQGKCWGVSSASPTLESASEPLTTPLAKFGTLQSIGYAPVDMGWWTGNGPVYHYSATRTVDGISRPIILMYFLQGNEQDCGSDNIVRLTSANPTTTENQNVNVYTRYQTMPRYSASNGSGTFCVMSLDSL